MKTGIGLEEAVGLLTGGLSPLGEEQVPASGGLGRILAADVTAPMDQPPFDRSPLDGYALRWEDSVGASRETPVRLRVAGTVYAGGVPRQAIAPGQAVRVMTGAMLPEGGSCVLRQEDTDLGGQTVSIFKELRPWENWSERGGDYRAGTLLLKKGTRLDAAAVGLLASAGIGTVPVRRRPAVSLLVTGDEVVPPCVHPLPPGKIHDANMALLTARLTELGFPPVERESAPDDPRAVAEAMERLLRRAGFLITTGGVSVGERDIFHDALPLLGAEQVFWRIKAKPGTPALFSRYGGKPILSLSGNPFAAAATFELLARPVLAALSGDPALLPERKKARLETAFSKASPGRRFVRGRYAGGRVTLPEGHSSGVLSSLCGCNCLVDIPAGSGPLRAGEEIEILLL